MSVSALSHLALRPDLTVKRGRENSLAPCQAYPYGARIDTGCVSSGFLQHFDAPTNERVFPDDSLLRIGTAVPTSVLGVIFTFQHLAVRLPHDAV